ncbi:hypothetical protein J7T55_011998 [Diaporthe amygdali]|uniref:uncharacterized protein n=1 Tax=Phomopsis amygdali TaxID=1214568 RepID=UPI0022FEC749|nr:uncharacterized protein J7T55_011998 [Diaporthe amygdali]KAJ0123533.1 hypothetical protein J7T55_011998 [Diaporthe amygdali]
MVPLFLSRHTNTQADFLGISLPVYQLIHHWLGRVVVTQGALHCGFGFQSLVLSPSKVAGAVATVLLLITILLSLLPVRSAHSVLLTGSFLSFPSVLCMVAGGLFTTSACLRLIRKIYRGKPQVTEFFVLDDTATIWLRLGHSIQTRPGTYFYLRFPDLPLRLRFQSILTPVAFWRAETRGSSKEVAFSIPSPHSLALKSLRERHHEFNVSIEGPYGGGLHPGLYDLVILVAEGSGIAGVLPFALSILSRRKQDEEDKANSTAQPELYCDKTRKVDIVWKLEHNSQVQEAKAFFEDISKMEVLIHEDHSERSPHRQDSPRGGMQPLQQTSGHLKEAQQEDTEPLKWERRKNISMRQKRWEKRWETRWQEHYKTSDEHPALLTTLIRKESNRTPGKSILIACGSGHFCRVARVAARESNSSISFREVDYQPTSPCSDRGSKTKTTYDFKEMTDPETPRKEIPRLPMQPKQRRRSYRFGHVRSSSGRVGGGHRDLAASCWTAISWAIASAIWNTIPPRLQRLNSGAVTDLCRFNSQIHQLQDVELIDRRDRRHHIPPISPQESQLDPCSLVPSQ